MGFTGKTADGWGTEFFLVLFPHEDHNQTKKSTSPPFTRTNSSQILQKAQSTISICLLLLFTTVLLFTVSTLPSSTTTAVRRLSRRNLISSDKIPPKLPRALQGMGILYRRGTRAMNDVVVAHGVESLTREELKLFLRLFHRSSVASKSDLIFLFPFKSPSFDDPILQENDSFLKLLAHYSDKNHSRSSFDPAHFFKTSKKEITEPIWGKRNRLNSSEEGRTESTRPSYGSVLAFDTDELDPENSLSGFLDHVPMSLRRWACYPMLLGRVRRNFKHVMLVDVKEMLVLGDPLSRVRSLRPESVLVTMSTKHGRKNSDKNQSTRQQKWVNPGVVMGGSRGVRRLANAMLTDIVRASMQQHKKRNPITESGIFNQLVENGFVLKNVQVTVSTESVPELSSLGGNYLTLMGNYSLIRRGNSNLGINTVVMKHICSFAVDSTVYNDC